MVEDHVVNKPKDNSEIGLWGFILNLFGEYKGGEREGI